MMVVLEVMGEGPQLSSETLRPLESSPYMIVARRATAQSLQFLSSLHQAIRAHLRPGERSIPLAGKSKVIKSWAGRRKAVSAIVSANLLDNSPLYSPPTRTKRQALQANAFAFAEKESRLWEKVSGDGEV